MQQFHIWIKQVKSYIFRVKAWLEANWVHMGQFRLQNSSSIRPILHCSVSNWTRLVQMRLGLDYNYVDTWPLRSANVYIYMVWELGALRTLSSLHLSESFICADLELVAEVSSCSLLWVLGCQHWVAPPEVPMVCAGLPTLQHSGLGCHPGCSDRSSLLLPGRLLPHFLLWGEKKKSDTIKWRVFTSISGSKTSTVRSCMQEPGSINNYLRGDATRGQPPLTLVPSQASTGSGFLCMFVCMSVWAYVLALASRNSKPDEKQAVKVSVVGRSPSALPQTLLTVLLSKLFGLLVRYVSLGLQIGLVSNQNDDLETQQKKVSLLFHCSSWNNSRHLCNCQQVGMIKGYLQLVWILTWRPELKWKEEVQQSCWAFV